MEDLKHNAKTSEAKVEKLAQNLDATVARVSKLEEGMDHGQHERAS